MDLDTALTTLAADPAAPLDLAEVCLALARDDYPQLDAEAYLAELAGMAHEVRGRLRGPLSNRGAQLTRYLFHELGFRGNQKDYYDPRNSYLNEVMDRRTGLPILLSAVAMAVGTRAGLEVVGVGLPGHFVVKAVLDGEEQLFDPFHGGRLLSVEEAAALVQRVTGQAVELTPALLAPAPLGAIVQRMLTNLEGVYLGREDHARAARVIGRLCQLAPDDLVRRRNLGAVLLAMGRPGQAVGHLEAYLASGPA